MKKIVWLGWIGWMCFFAGIVSAEDRRTDISQSVSSLEEMVVTAGRVEEAKKELTVNVSVIDQEEIQNSTAHNLGDLLAERAGVYIRKYPGALTSVGIRGFRTETHGNDLKGHVLVLLDGRRAGTGNLAKIMTRNVERVEIIKGPASVQYGSAAVGGVVNVITRRGQEDQEAFVETKLGSFGYEELAAGFSGKHKIFDFSGSYSRSAMDDYDTADGDKFRNTGYDEDQHVSLNLGLEFMPHNRLGLIYTSFDADKIGDSGYLSMNDKDDYKDTRNKSIDLVYDGRTENGLFSWKARYFQGEDNDKWVSKPGSDPDGYDAWTTEPSEMDTDSEGAQAQVSLNGDAVTFTAGLDWVDYDIESTWAPNETGYDNLAGFILGKARLLDQRLILTAGLRYDEFNVEVNKPEGREEEEDNFSPSLGMAFLLNDHWKFRANYAEAFVMPAADELAADYSSWGTHYVGNPDLDPETSRTYEGGIDFSYNAFSSALTYFYTDFEDKIVSTTTNAGDKSWENVGEATIAGIEFEMSHDFGPMLGWGCQVKPYANLTWLTEYEDEETGEDLQYVSDVTASYGLTISNYDDLSANLNVTCFGDQDVVDYEHGTYEVTELDGFTVAGLSISKKIFQTEQYGGLTLKGEIQNLFDEEYEYVQGYPMPGRSFFIGMKYRY
jgi:vitamin B12 transporter